MRARESQFCLTAEAPEVTPNFFALAGFLLRGPRRTQGKGWPEQPEEGREGTRPLRALGDTQGQPGNFGVPSSTHHPPTLASFPSRLKASSGEMGSRFKKPESVRKVCKKFFCLMFSVAGAREQTLRGKAAYPLRPSPRSRGGVHGTRRKMLGPRPLESQSCGDPLLSEGRRAAPRALRGRRTCYWVALEWSVQGEAWCGGRQARPRATPSSASDRLALRGPRLPACHACPRGPWQGCFPGPEESLLPPGRAASTQPPFPAEAVGTWVLLWVAFLGPELVCLRRPMSAL